MLNKSSHLIGQNRSRDFSHARLPVHSFFKDSRMPAYEVIIFFQICPFPRVTDRINTFCWDHHWFTCKKFHCASADTIQNFLCEIPEWS